MGQIERPSTTPTWRDQECGSERRRAPRMAGNGRVYLALEGETATAQLEDHSEGGLRMRSRAALAPGAIVFCAVPSLAICTRARVVHIKRRLLSKSVGLQYLATLSDFA